MDIIEQLAKIGYITKLTVPTLKTVIHDYKANHRTMCTTIKVIGKLLTGRDSIAEQKMKERQIVRCEKLHLVIERLTAELHLKTRLQENLASVQPLQDFAKYKEVHQRCFRKRYERGQQLLEQLDIMYQFAASSNSSSPFPRPLPIELRQLIRGRMDEIEQMQREMIFLRSTHRDLANEPIDL